MHVVVLVNYDTHTLGVLDGIITSSYQFDLHHSNCLRLKIPFHPGISHHCPILPLYRHKGGAIMNITDASALWAHHVLSGHRLLVMGISCTWLQQHVCMADKLFHHCLVICTFKKEEPPITVSNHIIQTLAASRWQTATQHYRGTDDHMESATESMIFGCPVMYYFISLAERQ